MRTTDGVWYRRDHSRGGLAVQEEKGLHRGERGTRAEKKEARTFGSGTSHLPAFSFLFCLMVLLRTFARAVCGFQRIGGRR